MSDTPGRSLGRKTIRVSAKPRELMSPTPDLAGVWKAKVITLFPTAFPGVLGESLTGKALQEGLWQLEPIDLRQFGIGKHRNVDDTPAGGGATPRSRIHPDSVFAVGFTESLDPTSFETHEALRLARSADPRAGSEFVVGQLSPQIAGLR